MSVEGARDKGLRSVNLFNTTTCAHRAHTSIECILFGGAWIVGDFQPTRLRGRIMVNIEVAALVEAMV